MYEESINAQFEYGLKYLSSNRILFKIDSLEIERIYALESNYGNVFKTIFQNKNVEYECNLVSDFTYYDFKIFMEGIYDKEIFFPNYFNYFWEIKSENINENLAFQIAQAYIFELSSAFDVDIHIDSIKNYDPYDYRLEENPNFENIRLRPLLVGKGMEELLSLFNSTNRIDDSEILILYYTKVIEYVSKTVLKKEMLNKVLNKLASSKALNPDANYVLELEKLFEEQRNYKKDKEAIRLTIETCCDADELSSDAPIFLKKLKKIKISSSKEEKNQGLNELANAISNTRNMIAHAKTNYKMSGSECPSNELEEFAYCLKKVAQQVIRWFARQNDSERVL